MAEEKKNENNNLQSSVRSDIDNRNQNKNLTKIEFPKIRKRSSIMKTQMYKLILKTEDEKENEQRIMNNIFRHSTPCDICIEALKKSPAERSEQLIIIISFYLQMLKNFMNIFKDQIESEELKELLYNMSSQLKYEHIDKNKFIFKFGDKANKFYIILKGKVTFCVPKINKFYLNEEDYILFLIKLRLHKENDLIKKNMEHNRCIYDLGDNFDHFVLKSLIRHEKEEEKIYSDMIYSYFKKIKEIIEKEKEKEKRNKKKDKEEIKYEDINLEDYLKRTTINNNISQEEAKRTNKKLLEIYKYERTNTFESGDCFGLVGSNNKSHKRSATAITYDDCELAVLFREEYNEILNKMTKKSRERLYNLVSSHKIFTQISKYTFGNKYSHMFRFNKFYFNNIIMDDTQKFNQVIIFNSGEFILSVNKNIIELNELIMKIKKIKGNLQNIPEEIIKKDLNEIKENEAYILNKKYTLNAINEFIYKKQNIIISTINDKMCLGYPDTVDPETFMPLFNCKCISNYATGYIVEREMINLFKKDHYLRTTPSQIVLLKIEFYLKRLLQHKKNIMKRIEILKLNNKQLNKNNINIKNNNNNDMLNESKEEIKDSNDDINNNNLDQNNIEEKSDIYNEETENNINISRNNINPINLKSNNIFEFQTKIISSQLEQSINNPNLTSINHIKKNNYSLDKAITQNKENDSDNFYKSISKIKQKIDKKKYLLRAIQHQSHKFMIKENIDKKKIQIKLNKLMYKDKYNDLTTIFSKDPLRKKSLLNKYLTKNNEDNVLDPEINNINKQIQNEQKLFSFFPNSNTNRIKENTSDVNEDNYSQINNISITNNSINNYQKNFVYKKIKNKLKINNENENNGKGYTLSNSFNNKRRLKQQLLLSPIDLKLNHIKLKYNNLSLDVDKIKNKHNFNKNNLKILSNELYNEYIINELNKKHINNILNNSIKTEFEQKNTKIDNLLDHYQKLDNYKLNKLQLMNVGKEKEKEIKSNYLPSNLQTFSCEKKGISLVDPLLLDKFNQIYKKGRLNEI